MNYLNKLYPHLLPEDIGIWEEYLSLHKEEFDYFEYDVRVGEGVCYPDQLNKKYDHMCTQLSQRRIDAIGYTDATLTIIEITHTITLKAIGQVFTYPILYRLKYPTDLQIDTLLVAGQIDTDLEVVLNELDIKYVLVNNPRSPADA